MSRKRRHFFKKGGNGNGIFFSYLGASSGKPLLYRNKENKMYSDYLDGRSSDTSALKLTPLHRALRKLSTGERLTSEDIQLIMNFINDCQGLAPAYCEERKNLLLLKIKENKGETLNENEKQQITYRSSQGAPTHIYVYS
jgi:hypothetical protein